MRHASAGVISTHRSWSFWYLASRISKYRTGSPGRFIQFNAGQDRTGSGGRSCVITQPARFPGRTGEERETHPAPLRAGRFPPGRDRCPAAGWLSTCNVHPKLPDLQSKSIVLAI
jgi:hypothetical protein